MKYSINSKKVRSATYIYYNANTLHTIMYRTENSEKVIEARKMRMIRFSKFTTVLDPLFEYFSMQMCTARMAGNTTVGYDDN